MSYNKAREEKKWKKWKQEEEKQLREKKFSENKIQELHDYDWEVFKAERRFREKEFPSNTFQDYINAFEISYLMNNINDIVEQIEDENLYQIFSNIGKVTLKILYLRMCGYNTKEIARLLNMKEEAVRYRVRKLKRKLKKFI